MAQSSRDFGEFLRLSLCAAVASVAVDEDGLDRILIRLARARSSAATDDRGIATRGTRSGPAGQPRADRGRGGRRGVPRQRCRRTVTGYS